MSELPRCTNRHDRKPSAKRKTKTNRIEARAISWHNEIFIVRRRLRHDPKSGCVCARMNIEYLNKCFTAKRECKLSRCSGAIGPLQRQSYSALYIIINSCISINTKLGAIIFVDWISGERKKKKKSVKQIQNSIDWLQHLAETLSSHSHQHH